MEKDKCMLGYENKIRDFAKHVRNKKVLDVGCGNGNYTSLFAKNGNVVFGVDINDFRHKIYKDKFTYKKYNGKRLPFNNNEFDVVVSFDVIEHVEDDVLFFSEINRVLKKGGIIYVATPNRTRLSNIILKMIGRPVTYPYILSEGGRLGAVVHLREYIGEELSNLSKKTKFNKTKLEYFWFGLRGRVNVGINYPVIKALSQCLFMTSKK